jgi:hypothetical protein
MVTALQKRLQRGGRIHLSGRRTLERKGHAVTQSGSARGSIWDDAARGSWLGHDRMGTRCALAAIRHREKWHGIKVRFGLVGAWTAGTSSLHFQARNASRKERLASQEELVVVRVLVWPCFTQPLWLDGPHRFGR